MTIPSMVANFTTIINNYNYDRYLARAIDSVLKQSNPPPLIVVDDGSTDRSREIIESYGDALIALFRENGGQARACLAALEKVDTPYVHFLDADDAMMPGFADAIGAATAENPVKIQVQLRSVDAQGVPSGSVFPNYPDGYDSAGMLRDIDSWGIPIAPPTSGNIFRTDLFEVLGSGYDYETAIDGVILYLAPAKGDVISINTPLIDYRIHGTNEHQQHVLSAARMHKEIRRMEDRLAHFAALVPTGSYSAERQRIPGQQHEWQMIATIAEGKRPSPSSIARYSASLWHSSFGAKRSLALTAWAALLGLLHDPARRSLAAWRLSSVNRPNFRQLLSPRRDRIR